MTMTEAGEDTPMGPAKSGAAELSAEEEAATAKFLENVNKWREARQMGEVSHGVMYFMFGCQHCY